MSPVEEERDFQRPVNDDEVIDLVRRARREKRRIRVRGSGHSVAHAIYADPLDALPNKPIEPGPPDRYLVPSPDRTNFDVLLDANPRYRVLSKEHRLIEVDAGMRLRDLLRDLSDRHGWMLAGTGGITHQTVGGFTATGSAGGSLQHSINDSICGFSLIDGLGERWEVNRGDPEFAAMVPNLGLLGIVTKVRLCCEQNYIIVGLQRTTSPDEAEVVLCGRPNAKQRSLTKFLTDATYGRIEWWPQRGAERVIVWEAQRGTLKEPYDPDEFELFRPNKPHVAQVLSGLIYTVLGNLEDRERIPAELTEIYQRLRGDRELLKEVLEILGELGPVGQMLAWIIRKALGDGLREAVEAHLDLSWIKDQIPSFFPALLNWLVPLDVKLGGPQEFSDYAWHGLPMDDVVVDRYMPVGFTELWVPMGQVEKVMQLLHERFGIGEKSPIDDSTAYERTGTFAVELYATKCNAFWLHPAYSGRDDDEWAKGAFRVNPYWYGRNAGDPAASFFRPLWELLLENKIPYRLHWGKFLPRVEDDPGWVGRISGQYSCWNEFLELRKERDPEGIFLNQYWRDHLGIDP